MVLDYVVAPTVPIVALRLRLAEASPFLHRFQYSLRFLLAAPTRSLGSGPDRLPLVVHLRLHLATPPIAFAIPQSAPHHLYLLPPFVFLLPTGGAPVRIAQTEVAFRADHPPDNFKVGFGQGEEVLRLTPVAAP